MATRTTVAPEPETAAAPPAAPPDLNDPSLYINRELSWLAFNQRVLAQATRPDASAARAREVPRHRRHQPRRVLHGARRHAAEEIPRRHRRRVARRPAHRAAARGDPPARVADARRHGDVLAGAAAPAARGRRHPLPRAVGLHAGDPRAPRAATSRRDIWPVLTPLAFDPGHPFPYISNLSTNLAVVVRHNGRTKFARVKVPDMLPRFIPLPDRLSGPAHPTSRARVRLPRGRHPREHPGAVPRHAGRRARTCSASSATPTS